MLINIVGKFYDNHSLSIVNRNLALELIKNNIDVKITPIDSIENSTIDTGTLTTLMSLNKQLGPIDIEVRHTYPPIWRWPDHEKTKVVYIQPWEYESMPSEWQYKFDTFADAVIIPSLWNKQVYENAGINPKKLFVVPNGYNEKVFYNKNIRTNNKIKFVYVGCNQYRKGLDFLLHIWSSVTTIYDNLELIIKDNPNVYGQTDLLSEIIKLQYNKKCATISYIDKDLTEDEMSDLYNNGHVIIHPYRGEGFGMHIQEAMACGCIPIVTEGGPTDEFVSDFKIQSSKSVVNMYNIFGMKPEDSLSNMGQHRTILEPNGQSLFNILKHVTENINKIQVDTSRLKTWEVIGKEYVEVFNTINSKENLIRHK